MSEPLVPSQAGDLRVYFAGQRTMLAWIRTGVALMGFGFVVARFGLFLRELAVARGVDTAQHSGASIWAGTILLAVGVAANSVAAARFYRFARQFKAGVTPRPTSFVPELAVAFFLAALGVLLITYLMSVG